MQRFGNQASQLVACLAIASVLLFARESNADPIRSLSQLQQQFSSLEAQEVRFRQSVNRATLVYIRFTTTDQSPGAPAETLSHNSPRSAGGTVWLVAGKDRFLLEHDLPDLSLPVWLSRDGRLFGSSIETSRSGVFHANIEQKYDPTTFELSALQFRFFLPSQFWRNELQSWLDIGTQAVSRPSGSPAFTILPISAGVTVLETKANIESKLGRSVVTTRLRFEPGLGGIESLPTRKERFTDFHPVGSADPVRAVNEVWTLKWAEVSLGRERVAMPIEYESTRYVNLLQDRARSTPGYIYSWRIDPESVTSADRAGADPRLARMNPDVTVARNQSNTVARDASEKNWWFITFVVLSAILIVMLAIRVRSRAKTHA